MKAGRFLQIVVYIGLINFAIFLIIASFIGGDALSGKVQDGHYYVAYHGQFTEVSYTIFIYSKLHALSLLITHTFTIIAIFLLWISKKKRKLTSPETNPME
jgi:hypothetical protein